MKKIKKLPFILSVVSCLAMAFGGCSLAVPEGEGGNKIPPNVKTEFEDCYVGQMFSISDKNSGEILTSETMGDETCVAYAFKYVANYFDWAYDHKGLIYSDISGEDYITHVKNNVDISDGGEKHSVELTLYLNADEQENKVFAFDNLLYDENGDVKIDYGIGNSGTFSKLSSKYEVTQTITKTVNGNTSERFLTFCVIMTLEVKEVGDNWKILQYNEDGELIKTDEVSKTDEGDILLEEGCAYVVQEETLKDGTKIRELKELNDEENYINFYYDGGFGLLTNKPFKLIKAVTE